MKLLHKSLCIFLFGLSTISQASKYNDSEYEQALDNLVTSIQMLEEENVLQDNLDYIKTILSEMKCLNLTRVSSDLDEKPLKTSTRLLVNQQVNELLNDCNKPSQVANTQVKDEELNKKDAETSGFRGVYESLRDEQRSDIPFKLLTSNDKYYSNGKERYFKDVLGEMEFFIKRLSSDNVLNFNNLIDTISGTECLLAASMFHNLVESGPELRKTISDQEMKIIIKVRNEIFRTCQSPKQIFQPVD